METLKSQQLQGLSHLSQFPDDICIRHLDPRPPTLRVISWNCLVDRTAFYHLKALILFQENTKYNFYDKRRFVCFASLSTNTLPLNLKTFLLCHSEKESHITNKQD